MKDMRRQWCEPHWALFRDGNANGILAAVKLMERFVNNEYVQKKTRGKKHRLNQVMNQLCAKHGAICCFLGDGVMEEIFEECRMDGVVSGHDTEDDRPILYRSISDWWDDFAKDTIPDVSLTQHLEMRKAFYAGVVNMLTALSEIQDDDVEEPDAYEQLQRLSQEVDAFFKPGGGLYDSPE